MSVRIIVVLRIIGVCLMLPFLLMAFLSGGQGAEDFFLAAVVGALLLAATYAATYLRKSA
jgi:hypothetical protein